MLLQGFKQVACFKFTPAALKKHCQALPKGKSAWDTETRGLGAYASVSGDISLFVHFRLANGRQRKKTIGRLNEISLSEARHLAQRYRLAGRQGQDLIREQRAREAKSLTLDDAHKQYLESLGRRGVSTNTLRLNDRLWRLMLSPYASRELKSITKKDVRGWHTGWRPHGPTAANQAARFLRTIWNSASKYEEHLPPNPCSAVDFFQERELRRSISLSDLAVWYASVSAIENPVRRSYWRFLLYSGLRKEDAASIRWDEVAGDVIRRPNPKGGRTKAFDLPITRQLRSILADTKNAGSVLLPGSPYVFPSTSKRGYLTNPREPSVIPGVSPHDIRRTFATACAEAGIDPYVIKILLNHTSDKSDVTALYVRHSKAHVAAAAQRVADYLEAKTCAAITETMHQGRLSGRTIRPASECRPCPTA